MAISPTQLTAGTDSDGNTTAVTASITPTANRLIIVGIGVYVASPPNRTISTVTGNGITYDEILESADIDDGFGPYRVLVYRGMSASPSAGAITITASGTTSQMDWAVCEFDGVDTSGTNGSGAIVQSATAAADEQTSLSIVLSAFADAGNGAFCAAASYDGVAFTVDTGWTSLDASTQLKTEWRADPDTTAGFSWTGARDSVGVAIEIKAAGGAVWPPVDNPAAPPLRVARSNLRLG